MLFGEGKVRVESLEEKVSVLEEHKVTPLEARVAELERHRIECDELHIKSAEHTKRHDDSMNNLTESNLLLAKSITDMNLTLVKVTATVEEGQPIIKGMKNVGVAWDVNKKIFLALVAAASGIMTLVAIYQYFV